MDPKTLNRESQTPHTKHQPRNLKSQTPTPKSQAQNPKPQTSDLKPQTLNPEQGKPVETKGVACG